MRRLLKKIKSTYIGWADGMIGYAMARKEVFEDARVKPSGAMPINADEKKRSRSMRPKQTVTTANGPRMDRTSKCKRKARQTWAHFHCPPLHWSKATEMGDTEFESVTSAV